MKLNRKYVGPILQTKRLGSAFRSWGWTSLCISKINMMSRPIALSLELNLARFLIISCASNAPTKDC